MNAAIEEQGRALLGALEKQKPSIFDEGRLIGKVMGWSLEHDAFRTALLRFIDVFPTLSTPAPSSTTSSHISMRWRRLPPPCCAMP